jgi:hypothetical protein
VDVGVLQKDLKDLGTNLIYQLILTIGLVKPLKVDSKKAKL